MLRSLLQFWSVLSLLVILPAGLSAQQSARASSAAEAEIRAAVRRYDDALRRADSAAVEKFWATEYTFINPRGEHVSRAARLANLRTGRTSLDSLGHTPQRSRSACTATWRSTRRSSRSAAATAARPSRDDSAPR